jgi:hypothetical protein
VEVTKTMVSIPTATTQADEVKWVEVDTNEQ